MSYSWRTLTLAVNPCSSLISMWLIVVMPQLFLFYYDTHAVWLKLVCLFVFSLFFISFFFVFGLCKSQEAYRRWVCSTLIPYFAEPIDIRQNRNEENKENTNNNNNNNINYNNNVNNNEPNSKSLHPSLSDDGDEKTQVGLVSDDPVVFKILNRYAIWRMLELFDFSSFDFVQCTTWACVMKMKKNCL